MIVAQLYEYLRYYKLVSLLYSNGSCAWRSWRSWSKIQEGAIVYPIQSRHYTMFELMIAGHPTDPRIIKETNPR